MPLVKEHLDEIQSLYFENQLTLINSKVFEKKYPKLKAREVFPLDNESRPGVRKLNYRIYDEVGMAKIIATCADDAPRVDIVAEEMEATVRTLADAYGYCLDEIEAAQLAGLDLDARKASIARRKMLVAENKLAWFGDVNYNIQGFLNHPNIPLMTVPADGQGNQTEFETKTPDQIIRDVNALIESVDEQTNEVHSANTLLLPSNKKAQFRRRVSDTGITILEYLKNNNPEIENIVWVKELKNPFGNGDMMVTGEMDPENATLEVTQEFNPLAPQLRNFEFLINCKSKTAGVVVRFPLAFGFAEGI